MVKIFNLHDYKKNKIPPIPEVDAGLVDDHSLEAQLKRSREFKEWQARERNKRNNNALAEYNIKNKNNEKK